APGRAHRRLSRGAPHDREGEPARGRRALPGRPGRAAVRRRRARLRGRVQLGPRDRGSRDRGIGSARARHRRRGSRQGVFSMKDQKDLEGILLIDKPTGMTSHDVVDKVRRKLRIKRIGHAGTLDPMATGLLIILVGKATKLSQYLTSLDKAYSGEITLGVTTNTQDADGEVAVTKPVPALAREQVEEAMRAFVGDQYQTPPMFSAVKINGQRLYKLARKGQEVEREPRFIRVSRFDVTSFQPPVVGFSLDCSKGTYVRTLASDLGEKLGCGAHLSSLRRDASDRFHVKDAVGLDAFMEMAAPDIEAKLIPPHAA